MFIVILSNFSNTNRFFSAQNVVQYILDGNTNGEFLNSSTTHTNIEQGAWWQVDLGGKKKITDSSYQATEF
jgi:hypothetical protein